MIADVPPDEEDARHRLMHGDLRKRLISALGQQDPLSALEVVVAAEQARALRQSAEHLRNIGRRCKGQPGDRHRRHIANVCAELVVRRSREYARAAERRRETA